MMKKLALIAALPFSLGLAACDSTPDAADGDVTAVTATDDAMAADTSMVPPGDTAPAGNDVDRMNAKQLDTTAENIEEQTDRIEDTDEHAAEHLEAEAKRLQDARDAKK